VSDILGEVVRKILLFLCSCGLLLANPLKIAYQDRVIDALFIVANAQNLFENSGVELKRFSSGPATNEALLFGDVSMATMGDTAALIALSKYCPKVKIYSILGGGEARHSIVVRKESDIKTLQDLAGKKIAIKKGTSTHGGFLLKTSQMGVNLNKELMDLSPSLMAQALLSKEVDAIVASEPTPSVIIEKGFAKRLFSLDGVGSNYPLALVIKSESFDATKMSKVLRVLKKAQEFIKTNPQTSYEIISKATGLSLSSTKEAMAKHEYKVGFDDVSLKSLQKVANFLFEQKKIKSLPDFEACLIR
jgi:ABC-type nitrate/sulfonate/bicarbonate transport system substrate-binding protein